MLKDAFKANRWRFLLRLFALCLGLLALVSAEWATAVTFLSGVAIFSAVDSQATRASRGEDPPKWANGVFFAAGIGFLGVACANGFNGHVREAVLSGLAGAFVLVGAAVDRRRTSALSSSSA